MRSERGVSERGVFDNSFDEAVVRAFLIRTTIGEGFAYRRALDEMENLRHLGPREACWVCLRHGSCARHPPAGVR